MTAALAAHYDPDAATAVLLCGHLAADSRVDLRETAKWLEAGVPGVRVRLAPDLCRGGEEILRHYTAPGGGRLVIGLCDRPLSRPQLQMSVRRAGLDPLGVEAVDLGSWTAGHARGEATERAQLLLAAAVAKARVFAGSRPQNLKPVLPAAVSRRSMLTLAFLEYLTVPSIVGESCRVERGCALCVHACPHAALSVADGEIRLDKSLCSGCGLCVTACPHDAVDFPGARPAQIDAQISTLLDPALGSIQPRGIIFTCTHGTGALKALARSHAAYPANWLPVEVPCVEMVSSAWLLACLARGAAVVGMVPCPDTDHAEASGRLDGRVAFCQELLRRLGETEERVFLFPTAADALLSMLRRRLHPPRSTADFPGLFVSGSTAQTVQAVAQGYDAGNLAFAHPYSPFGVVEAAEGCTVCAACADACPTGALLLQQDGEAELTFDAARCVGCGWCLPACPEPGVLHLHQATDLHALATGRVELRRTAYRRCQVCGQPVAPEAMLDRIAELLGNEYTNIGSLIANYCQDCRSSAAHFSSS